MVPIAGNQGIQGIQGGQGKQGVQGWLCWCWYSGCYRYSRVLDGRKENKVLKVQGTQGEVWCDTGFQGKDGALLDKVFKVISRYKR